MKRILIVTQYIHPEPFKSSEMAFELVKTLAVEAVAVPAMKAVATPAEA